MDTTVLITGGAGFIGSHLIRQILHSQPTWKVRSFDLLNRNAEQSRLDDVITSERLEVWQGDVADRWAVRQALRDVRYVIHLAGEQSTDQAEVGNNTPVRTNILGICTLLDAAREFHVESFAHVSTSAIFPFRDEPYGEYDPPAPNTLYTATRASAEWLSLACHAEHDLPICIVRPSCIYGPWQLPSQVFPWLCWQLLHDRQTLFPVNVCQQLLHIEDCCAGILAALVNGRPGSIYHLAGLDEADGVGLADLIAKCLGKPSRAHLTANAKQGCLLLDSRETEDSLEWYPAVPLEDGIEQTVRWYADHREWLHRQWKRLYYSTDR